jgi:D-amino-acid dehydrogenase
MTRTLVIGAGVAGLSIATWLQRAGRRVTVLDPKPPGEGGASWGNSGIVSAALVAPLSAGALRDLPRWLLDPTGPLAVRPAHLPRALPWLWRWSRAGRDAEAVSDAIQALHRESFACWRELVGEATYAALIRETGQAVGFETPPAPGAGAIEARLRARHGIVTEMLDRAALERLFPGISPRVLRGMLLPGQGHIRDPGALLRALAARLREAGGTILAQRARGLQPGSPWRVATEDGTQEAEEVVMAAGIWSRELLAPLGVRLPLLAERGYNADLPPLPQIAIPISFRSRGLALTPMADALRASGTVEIAAADAPAAMRRARHLAAQAREIFPGIPAGEPRLWMGPRPGLPDGLPAIGAAGPPGLWLCCGHGHFGMTSAPPSARMLARMMLGAPPGVDAMPYAPGRFR